MKTAWDGKRHTQLVRNGSKSMNVESAAPRAQAYSTYDLANQMYIKLHL